jgi:hypothetical protein
MTSNKYIDIIDIKALINSGRFAVKINSLGAILLEDTQTCEAIKLMQLPSTYSFHEKGTWEPCFIHTDSNIDRCTGGHDGWACSVCGSRSDERSNWCTCGADMRQKFGERIR